MLRLTHTGCFIMFSTITNIYNKKNQRTDINGIVHSHRKTGKVFFLTNNRCSMCAPRVNMGASIFFTAATIRAFRSSRSRGNCRTNTRSLTHPQRKKYASNGFPIINFCNPGIHYETQYIFGDLNIVRFILLVLVFVVPIIF